MSEQLNVASRERYSRARRSLSFSGLWNNVAVRSWIYQLVIIAGVIGVGTFLIANAQNALSKQGISTGFGFLQQRAGFDIGETSIAFSSSDSFLKAYGVAVINTLKVAAASIVLATIVGVVVGIGRLSKNLLLNKLAAGYVEIFRNTPQLLQLIFWYTIITNLPRPRDAISIGGVFFLSNRGLSYPWFESAHYALLFGAFLAGCVAAWFLVRYTEGQGRRALRYVAWMFALGAIIGLPVLTGYFLGDARVISVPKLRGFNFFGGATTSPEFLALLLGLALYIAAFIAEIVRSGIQSVGQGQIEAARTIGLNRFDTYRKVIFPQALRVMVPPAAGQYISVVKNSSLGVVVGYPELFSVNNTVVTLSGHTVEAIAIMMSIYLAISFIIAMLMNFYNLFVQIKER